MIAAAIDEAARDDGAESTVTRGAPLGAVGREGHAEREGGCLARGPDPREVNEGNRQ